MVADYAETPVKVDGRLDEAVWQGAQVYTMNLADDRSVGGAKVEQDAEVRLAWNNEFLYLGVKFFDSDIVAEGKKDQEMHFSLGDVCELFLKPADKSWYWELYVTPRGKKSSFFFPSQGRLGLPSNFEYDCDLKVDAQIEGTLNNWSDTDKYWTGEMAMPIKDLTSRGESFGPASDWRILVARYNYSYQLPTSGAELTMTPKLTETNYHSLDEYAVLKMQK